MQQARCDALFMHCLPAFHDAATTISAEKAQQYKNEFPNIAAGAFEVTDKVFASPQSVVFDQAENRMHSIKAIMLMTLIEEIPAELT